MGWKGKGLITLLFITVLGGYALLNSTRVIESKELEDGTRLKFRTNGDQIEIYQDQSWSPRFIKGVNMGATLPGHFPGELPIKKEDYLRWFKMIDEMGVNTIRIYTIHHPVFYEALVEYNKDHQEQPLYFIQGVWSPVNVLNKTEDALSKKVTDEFKQEISHAVGAVYGDITIPKQSGKASGEYTVDASSYLTAWHIGTEWDPEIVRKTNDKHSDDPAFQGTYFKAADHASPFESWLAELINHTAEQEDKRGWQHPMTFTNWMTTDPLKHPQEPQKKEDMASVDATHIQVKNWDAGYFASFHSYPYYPDFLRYTDKYDEVKNNDGKVDTYKGYLQDLKNHHGSMPVMITEFGVPSSRGNAHNGPLDRDQGGHSETEQGKHNVDLLNHIYNEDFAGAVLFTWQDEWFKKTWNSMQLETDSRLPYWYNPLSPEMSYGVLGMYPEKSDALKIDGELKDWKKLDSEEVDEISTPLTDLNVTHDEGYVYISGHLPEKINLKEQSIYLGVDSLSGGSTSPQLLQGLRLDEGLETIVRLGEEKSEVLIASSYDFHQRMYEEASGSDKEGAFHSWKLAVSLPMRHPKTNEKIPFEEVEVGSMKRASEKGRPNWEIKGNVVEMKIPWALLGFSDPSTKQVISYESAGKKGEDLPTKVTDGIRFVPFVLDKETKELAGFEGMDESIPLDNFPKYKWKNWQKVNFIEKRKKSYYIMKEAFQNMND